ncbi:MAG: hypothetical protein AAGF83_24470 [Cyanobacteria bacterium P01_G01_bin.67]
MMTNGPAVKIEEIKEDPLYYNLPNRVLEFLYKRFVLPMMKPNVAEYLLRSLDRP